MILVWNNMDSFKRHLEDMRAFRQSHNNWQMAEAKTFKDMPVLIDVKPPRETGLIESITDNQGKLIFVPIWKMKRAGGSQN